MVERKIRFTVSDGQSKRAATWNLTVQDRVGKNPEIYLSCRELRGHIHTSFHPSGHWHTAYARDKFDEIVRDVAPPGADRFIQKWPRPLCIRPGITVAYRIITPSVTVSSEFRDERKNLVQIPKPAEGNAVQTIIVIADRGAQIGARDGQIVGNIKLSDGSQIVVWATELPMPNIKYPEVPVSGRFFKGRNRQDLQGEDIRALVFADDEEGNPTIVEHIVVIEKDISK